jgi:hypothetical protein
VNETSPSCRRASTRLRHLVAVALLGTTAAAVPPQSIAQQAASARPADKPPVAQGWIDIATFSNAGMPDMSAMMGGASPLGAMFGGGKAQGNQFGNTKGSGAGSYVDVTLRTSRNPSLAEAVQSVPAGSKLAPSLQLKVMPQSKPAVGDDGTVETYEPPKFRIKLYWGCGQTVRPGQPKMLDFATATSAQLAEIFNGRRATQRGTHLAAGRPVWPNLQDKRLVPPGASFAGEHAFTGQGVPDGFKFTLPPAQDIMPAIALKQAQTDGVTHLTWQALPTARAYFIAAMGGRGEEATGDSKGSVEMTLWTSSEVPDSGLGLVEYQTNSAVDRWLKEKVLLAPTVTTCDVPKGIFGEGKDEAMGMLRMIAYGSELNLAHPPRPTDPKVAWEPEWAVKVRVKSVTSAPLGMPSMDEGGGAVEDGSGTGGEGSPDGVTPPEEPKKKKKFGLKDALDAVKDSVPH